MEALVAAAGRRLACGPALLGLGNLSNLLAAIAVGLHFDIPLDDMAERAAALVPAYHRGEVLRLPGGVTLIDDSCNKALPRSAGRSRRWRPPPGREEGGSARRDARTGRVPSSCTFQAERRAAAAGLDLLIGVGGSVVAAMTAEAVRRASPSVGSGT